MFSRGWLIAALVACVLASACSEFNTNLSVQTSSSSLTFVSPSGVAIGNVPATGLPITATGTGFVSTGTFILWNGVQLTNTVYVSSTTLTAVVPASDFATPGTIQVAIQIPGSAVSGSSSTNATTTTEVSNIVLFAINATPPPPPTIASISPSNIGAGSGAFTLTVTGTNFVNTPNTGSVIYWNSVPVTPTTVTGTTTASATIPASFVASIGPPNTANVSISNTLSGGVTTSSLPFTITSDSPTPSARLASTAGTDAGPRFAVFSMASTDGVTDAPGTIQNVFLRDTCEGVVSGCTPSTTLESVGTDGQWSNGDSISPSMSADGRYVAFVSSASNLITGDTNSAADVFVRDTCIGGPSGCVPSTQRASVASDGTQANDASASASISATGRYITFSSVATNLDPVNLTGSSGSSRTFLRDICAGAASGCTPSTQQLSLQK